VIPVRSLDNTVRGNNPEMPPSPQMLRFVCLHLESMVLTTGKMLRLRYLTYDGQIIHDHAIQ